MRNEKFHSKNESPATTLDKITAYIDKMAVLEFTVHRTDEAKALFMSNETRGQAWVYHSKGRISATASYDLVVQAFATSITDPAELERVAATGTLMHVEEHMNYQSYSSLVKAFRTPAAPLRVTAMIWIVAPHLRP